MATVEIRRLTRDHLTEAARIVGRRYDKLYESAPVLPSQYGEVEVLLPMLVSLLGAGSGVAAIVGGTLVGFLAGFPIPSFRGSPAVLSPEYGNGVWLESGDPAYVWDAMYAALAPDWVTDARTVHLVVLLATDGVGLAAWHTLGFGKVGSDAVRGLQPITATRTGGVIRRATLDDVPALTAFERALTDHLSAAPTYRMDHDEPSEAACAAILSDRKHAAWLASAADDPAGRPVSYLLCGPASQDAGTIIRDAGTCSITGAYTIPEYRSIGVATHLLDRALTWAQDQGYARCAVDFETTNPQARRFWLRHFTPITFALERHIDARATPSRD